ncbi:MAG: ABC transporter substrate-binding protein, partial [Calditrichaeota bacterium]|nr:ABC transporter substrate-binding protein [Calditrichota bacterium]
TLGMDPGPIAYRGDGPEVATGLSAIKKRFGSALFFLILLMAAGLSGCGETPSPKPPLKIGILCGVDFMIPVIDGFKAYLTEQGYVEGQGISYDVRITNFDMDGYRRILTGFVEDGVDLILVLPTEASLLAKEITAASKIPVVFCVANIEDNNLVSDVRNPGGNVTGVRYPGPDIAVKRFEILMELLPKVRNVCIPYQKGYPIVPSQLRALAPVASQKGVKIHEVPADDAAELRELMASAVKAGQKCDAILFIADPLTVHPDAFRAIADLARPRNLPVAGALIANEDFGTLFGVNIEPRGTGIQAAVIAAKILKGADPAVIPVVSSESFIQINFKMAQKMGIPVSEGLLSRSDEIIR